MEFAETEAIATSNAEQMHVMGVSIHAGVKRSSLAHGSLTLVITLAVARCTVTNLLNSLQMGV